MPREEEGPINLGYDGTSSPEQALHPVSSSQSSDDGRQHGVSPAKILQALTSPEYSKKAHGQKPVGITYSWQNVMVTAKCAKHEKDVAMCDNVEAGCCGLKRSSPARKEILRNVTGLARPNELLAIMGASGAGKTTLLNVLTFRNTKGLNISGQRCVNGQPLTRELMSTVGAYVQQDDLFVGTLTVREHLVFQARVRMDRTIPMSERLKRVDEVIQELGLSKCENTLIGIPGRMKGISGGEMKRLSFASEVLTDPPLMFCDEPTSGLDSYMAQNVVQVLKQLARKGKTIICTIHQPSSQVYTLFDRILLMAEGRTAYLGNASEALGYFRSLGHECPGHFNPSDFFIQTLAIRPGRIDECRERAAGICDSFDKTSYAATVKKDIEESKVGFGMKVKPILKSSPYKTSWSDQFGAVLWRSWLTLFKDPLLFRIRIAVTTFMALLFGLVYLRQDLNQQGVMNLSGVMFLMVANMTLQCSYGVISVFANEVPIFLREHFNGMYRTDVYFLSKTLAEIPMFLIIPFVFSTIIYWMVGFGDDFARYCVTAGIIILVANVAASFGYVLSCWAPSAGTALEATSFFIVPLLLFGGFFMNDDSTPVYFVWLKYLSWYRYGNEALSINQWRNVDEIECNRPYPGNSTCMNDGGMVLQNYGFSEDEFTLDILMLVVLIVSFRFLAFLGLLRKTWAN